MLVAASPQQPAASGQATARHVSAESSTPAPDELLVGFPLSGEGCGSTLGRQPWEGGQEDGVLGLWLLLPAPRGKGLLEDGPGWPQSLAWSPLPRQLPLTARQGPSWGLVAEETCAGPGSRAPQQLPRSRPSKARGSGSLGETEAGGESQVWRTQRQETKAARGWSAAGQGELGGLGTFSAEKRKWGGTRQLGWM